MLDRITTAAKIMERRCEWINQLSSEHISQECRDMYLELRDSLSGIVNLAKGDYQDIADMESLRQELDSSKDIWDSLVATGCERYGT